jgi:hypothetical protein
MRRKNLRLPLSLSNLKFEFELQPVLRRCQCPGPGPAPLGGGPPRLAGQCRSGSRAPAWAYKQSPGRCQCGGRELLPAQSEQPTLRLPASELERT